MASLPSLHGLIIDLPPSCIEVWPKSPQYFVVGTYFLEKNDADKTERTNDDLPSTSEDQKRSGSLVLGAVENERITILQTCPTPYAILDLHFSPHDNHSELLIAATSTGSLVVYTLSYPTSTENPATEPQPHPTLTFVKTLQIQHPSTLILSFNWHPMDADIVGVTLSSGEANICNVPSLKDKETTFDENTDQATLTDHPLEAWTLAFTPYGTGLFSGGDDSSLQYRELRSSLISEAGDLHNYVDRNTSSQWLERKLHGAGVTAILPLMEGVTVTGSYDDHVRVVKTPSFGRREVFAEANLGGGVWRLKAIEAPRLTFPGARELTWLILASCMHAGARIVRVTRYEKGKWDIEVVARFEEHKSMNYGSDVLARGGGTGKLILSTSFYDRLICLWRYSPQ
ncbi:hypothetical protein M501DRAFT_982982 [Patellaria atrata CBS 101060]|uniref:methylated diphthine methylhydrolase n=1 Tax=Patellaria atrata CBS 101060 TaxID=1346257 RepID=A0A9P4S4F2_9PEZI|nr:hypothetical protein M501DRAFT_982982 [Patellaria atrata CBS 101060]